jgi:hypothetical protein
MPSVAARILPYADELSSVGVYPQAIERGHMVLAHVEPGEYLSEASVVWEHSIGGDNQTNADKLDLTFFNRAVGNKLHLF